ncbi:MAG: outer membrane beta-barrel protein [Blastocatellia bacterium]
MRKMFFIVLAAAALLLIAPAQNAQAQSETPKVELGAHYTVLRLRDFDTTDSGVGGRITFNVTDSFGIEGEVNFFPEKRVNFANPFYLDSRRTQGLFGVKYGMRSEKAGIFGKLRPGFVHFGESIPDPRILFILPIAPTASSTEFALDVGGVFELYPTRAVALRFDVGDTIIRFGGRQDFNSHNLQFTAGVAFRF